MLRAGYQSLPCKLPGNRGIDGIFVKYGADGKPVDILIVESKFSSSGWYNLPNTKKGKQLSEKWIRGNIKKMLDSKNADLRSTANLIRNYVAKKIVRVKLNMFNPKGINRWNTFDSFILKSRGKY